jgi:hypothetical protein
MLVIHVRVDIFRAMVGHYSSEKEILSVPAFVFRLVLHVRSKEGGGSIIETYNFLDALNYYGSGFTVAELAVVYRRAGSAFKGQLH